MHTPVGTVARQCSTAGTVPQNPQPNPSHTNTHRTAALAKQLGGEKTGTLVGDMGPGRTPECSLWQQAQTLLDRINPTILYVDTNMQLVVLC